MEAEEYIYNLGIAFYSTADQYASRIALRYPSGTEHTYSEINLRSNQIARFLLGRKVTKGSVVAIFNNKSCEAYCLMLACLKIGVTYTNLDDSSPEERIRKLVVSCHPQVIFYGDENNPIARRMGDLFEWLKCYYLHESDLKAAVDSQGGSNLMETMQVHGGDPAYIMFTSGSTGFPKGAVMSHANVLNFIQWGRQTFSIRPEDVFTNVNPIYFDNSVFDFYNSLFSGATMVPLDGEIVKNPKNLVEAINKTQCTIWFSVPSLLVYLLTTKALSEGDFQSLKRIVFGGEGFPKSKLKQLFDLFGKRIRLFNVYGPTECTCICSSYLIGEEDFVNMTALAPLGYMAPNFGYEILPINKDNPNFGELGLTGPCVGLGYFNDPERTAHAFVQNPTKSYHERMYRTGDIVERADNGYLHFRGRMDNQIKHMGYRIELEEIEAACNSLGYVDEVGVIYEKINPELGQIKAFIRLGKTGKDQKEIQKDIAGILPPYMIPKVIILDSLPKNRNGKIDRKQLAILHKI